MAEPVEIPFPVSSSPGVRPQESGGRLINCFPEKAPVGAPGDLIYLRTPGLRQVAETLAHSHTRGFLDCGSTLLWILTDRVYAVSTSFVATNLGALLGSDAVTTARNNNAVPQNVVVTANGCFNLFVGGAPTAFADADLPSTPTSVCDLDGFFVWSFGDGRIFASDLNSVSVAANSTTTVQGLFARRVLRYGGRLYVFGDKFTVVYRNAGLSPFPFSREATIPRGIVGTHAVAGWETGWANTLIWCGDDFVVYKLQGYTPVAISTPPVSRAIQAAVLAGRAATIQATIFMFGDNAFWTVSDPGFWSWQYNLTTGNWNENVSYTRTDWKGRRSVKIFDRWLIGDDLTGKLFESTSDYYREGNDPLLWSAESGIISSFPRGIVIPEATFALTAGTGSVGTEIDPKVLISWSLDGGHTYGNPVQRRIGGPGETRNLVKILNCGLSRGQGVRFKLEVSDPVHIGLSGGKINPELRMTA